MSTFLIFALLLASTYAQDEGGLMECVKGSKTGDKVAAAIGACSNFDDYDNTADRNDGMCYDFNNTISWLYEVYSHDFCILNEMGWVNENMTDYNWDQWLADINGLPEDVSGALMEGHDEWQLCWEDKVTDWGNDECYNGTNSLYSEDEKMKLVHIGSMVAQYECFRDGLMEACFGNDQDVLEQCVAGSGTGEKIEDAFESCFNDDQTEVSRSLAKKLSFQSRNDNETQCYDYNTTMDWMNSYYADDMCVLDHMGWLLNNGTTGWNLTTWIDDINDLPVETAKGIWDKQNMWTECVAYLIDEGTNNTCWNGTESLYSDEEREELGQVGTMIAEYECFRHYFHETCFELYGDNGNDDDDAYNYNDYYGNSGEDDYGVDSYY